MSVEVKALKETSVCLFSNTLFQTLDSNDENGYQGVVQFILYLPSLTPNEGNTWMLGEQSTTKYHVKNATLNLGVSWCLSASVLICFAVDVFISVFPSWLSSSQAKPLLIIHHTEVIYNFIQSF